MTVPCGVATLICKSTQKIYPNDGELPWTEGGVLLGLRKGAHGAGMWSLPGGKIEPGEYPRNAAMREVREETGIDLKMVAPYHLVPFNNTIAGGQPWVTLFFITWVTEDTEPQLMEPEKCERWGWFQLHSLYRPAPLFEPLAELVDDVERWRRYRTDEEGEVMREKP